MSPKWCSTWFLFVLALTGSAQDLRLAGPIAGLVYDQPSRSLRQVLGTPGAARLSPAILAELDWASVAPNGRIALVMTGDGMRLFSSEGAVPNPGGTPVNGVVDSPALFSWAADSRAVALYSAANRSVQWVRLSDQGAITDVPSPLIGIDGDVSALAGDDASGVVVIAVANSGIYQVSPSAGTRQVIPVPDVSALALESGGRTLWIADRTNTQILRVAAPEADAAAHAVLADQEKLGDITAMALSSDGNRLYLANRTTQRLYVLDPTTPSLSEGIELDSPVTQFATLGRPSLLLLLGLREKPSQPFYVFDETSSRGVFFIPAGEGQ